MATFDPQPVGGNQSTGGTGGGSETTNPIEQVFTGFEELVNYLANEPVVALGLFTVIAGAYFAKKKYEEKNDKEQKYEGKDWSKIIPNDLKFMLNKVGFQTDKRLTRGDFNDLGKVQSYDIKQMPEGYEYQDLIHGNIDDIDEEEANMKEVYVFMVAPEGFVSNNIWKVTDLYLDNNRSTTLFVVSSDSVEEEAGRFKLKEDIQFKESPEYKSILVEKGVETENVTDSIPLYQSRKNVVEGLEEFSMKALFLDRTHASSIANKREDMDIEEFLKRMRGGQNF